MARNGAVAAPAVVTSPAWRTPRRLARRARAFVEQVVFGQAVSGLDPKDVQSYYRTTNA